MAGAEKRECCPGRFSCKRVRIILPFLVFCVFLPFLDVLTDIYGGATLIEAGHIRWGGATLALSLMPFVGHVAATNFMSSSRRRRSDFMRELKKEAWQHLPLFQAIKNTSYFLELCSMDTDETSNYSKIERIQTAASNLGLYEAFLEAGPQLVLQLSIVLRSGYVSTTQLISMPISLLSLAYGSTKAFYSQRLSPFSDPNPPLLKYVIALFFPHVLVTLCIIIAWTFVFAYSGWFACVELVLTVAAKYLLYRSFEVDSNLEKLEQDSSSSSSSVTVAKQHCSSSAANLTWKSIFTSIMSPCVVGHHKSCMLILSHLSTVLCLLMWLLLISPVQRFLAPVYMDNNPPVTHCFFRQQETQHKICLWDGAQIVECNQSYIRRCDEEPCFSTVRFCQDDDENELTVLNEMVVPILSMLLLTSILVGQALQWLSSYANLYRVYRRIYKKVVVLHRSLLCANAAEDDHKILDQIIKDKGDKRSSRFNLRDVVSRCNADGDTPLHIACRKGHHEFARKLLFSCVAKWDKRDSLGQTSLHVAAAWGNVMCVRLMLSDSLLIMKKDLNDMLAFDLACRNGHTDAAKVILHPVYLPSLRLDESNAQDRQSSIDWKGLTFLHLAVLSGNMKYLERVLSATEDLYGFRGEDLLEERDEDGRTPLHLAAYCGFTDAVKVLMEKGADVEARDNDDKLPLMLAYEYGHKDIMYLILGVRWGKVKLLYEACKQERTSFLSYLVNIVIEKGDCSLLNYLYHSNSLKPRKEQKLTPTPKHNVLKQVADATKTYFKPQSVKQLLDHNDEDYGTLAHVAARFGQLDNLKYLHEKGADLHVTSKEGNSLLHEAAIFGHLECLKYLLTSTEAGGVDLPNQSGDTPLHLAAKWGHLACLEHLTSLCGGGDAVDRRNNFGNTPLHLAVWGCSLACVKFLVSKGADQNSRNNRGEHIVHRASSKSKRRQWKVEEATQILLFLTEQTGVIWNVKDERGRDALTVASKYGFRQAVPILKPLMT